jgi:hypothetical protein
MISKPIFLNNFRRVIDPNTEYLLNESNHPTLVVTDFDEYVRPDYVEVTLSDNRKLRIHKKTVKGGAKFYQAVLHALDTYNENPKAKQFMDQIVNAMAKELDKK